MSCKDCKSAPIGTETKERIQNVVSDFRCQWACSFYACGWRLCPWLGDGAKWAKSAMSAHFCVERAQCNRDSVGSAEG